MSPVMIKLLKQHDEIEEKIKSFQKKCKHKNKISVNRGNTGNLDYNVYWVQNDCPNCGKFWDSDRKEVLAY